jgi:SRSO17 transposase
LLGLLSSLAGKNSWTIAVAAGDDNSGRDAAAAQQLPVGRRCVRDGLRAYVAEYIAADDGVLIVDETGFLKSRASSPLAIRSAVR